MTLAMAGVTQLMCPVIGTHVWHELPARAALRLASRPLHTMPDFLVKSCERILLQTVILVGVILLTANTASTYYNWVILYAFSQFIFGFGIGGEYPVRCCVRKFIGISRSL